MKIYIDSGRLSGKPPRLCLHEPEGKGERDLLDGLTESYVISGMGRHPETAHILHVELPLEET